MSFTLPDYNKYDNWGDLRFSYEDASNTLMWLAQTARENGQQPSSIGYDVIYHHEPLITQIIAIDAYDGAGTPYDRNHVPEQVEAFSSILTTTDKMVELFRDAEVGDYTAEVPSSVFHYYNDCIGTVKAGGLSRDDIINTTTAFVTTLSSDPTGKGVQRAMRLINPVHGFRPTGPGGASGFSAPRGLG